MPHNKHLRHVRRSEHSFRHPGEEEYLAHIHMTIRRILLTFGMVPLATSLVAIWISAHPHFAEKYDQNMTAWIRENFHYNESGNGDIWVYYENGSIWNIEAQWAPLFTKNVSAYKFGFYNRTYCNPREIDSLDHFWASSIFRASQLYASVQTGLRYGVLFVFLPMILNTFIMVKRLVIENQSLFFAVIGSLYFCNEIFIHVSYFLLTTLHVELENEYIPYSSVYLSAAIIFSLLKLMLRNFTEPFGFPTVLRIFGAIILVISHNPLTESAQEFIDFVTCDTFVSPTVSLLELACIAVVFLNNLYDVQQSKFLHLVVSQTADEVNIQKITKQSVFRRMKPSAVP